MSQHAIIESAKDMVDDEDIEEAISNGQLLEDYPDDRRGHSCLICSKIRDGRYFVVVGMTEENAVMITTYLPSRINGKHHSKGGKTMDRCFYCKGTLEKGL